MKESCVLREHVNRTTDNLMLTLKSGGQTRMLWGGIAIGDSFIRSTVLIRTTITSINEPSCHTRVGHTTAWMDKVAFTSMWPQSHGEPHSSTRLLTFPSEPAAAQTVWHRSLDRWRRCAYSIYKRLWSLSCHLNKKECSGRVTARVSFESSRSVPGLSDEDGIG